MRASLLVVAVLAAGCSKPPAEDFPPARGSAQAEPPASAPAAVTVAASAPAAPSARPLAGRCVRPTPAAAPPLATPGPAVGCPADPEGGPPAVPVVRVSVREAAGAAVDAELVASPHDTARGLMYRRSMAEDHGMLFDLRQREDHQFWMHNTCIPLDLLYVDEDGLIVGIVENAPTLDDGSRGVGCPSLYVLEVNAGWSRRHGVKAGQTLVLPPRPGSAGARPPPDSARGGTPSGQKP